MSLNIAQSPEHSSQDEKNNQNVSAVIERLKVQKALPPNVFGNDFEPNSPFESHIKSLFQDLTDVNFYTVFKSIMTLPDGNNNELMQKRLSGMQIMSFAQVIFYKVFPCPEKECASCPRETAIKNQYKDYEFECPFYHHNKDARRITLTPNINEEFLYKANYFEEKKYEASEKNKCSQNYFESMFHPLYYKMFKCKRDYCNFSLYCPFYHSEEEKKAWDRTFSNFIRKDRINYVKEKEKYFEKKNNYTSYVNVNVNVNAPKQTKTEFRLFRSSANPIGHTNDNTNNETSSPLSSYSNYSSKKQNYRPKAKFEPILTQPRQSENTSEKGFRSTFFKEKDWNQSEKQIHVKGIDGEVGTPSTSTSGDIHHKAWKSPNKPLC